MSYDMTFYETDNRQQLKQQLNAASGVAGNQPISMQEQEEAGVAALLNDWKEDNLDIDAIIRASGSNTQTTQASPYQAADHQVVPTFNSQQQLQRPNALDLTRQVKFEPRSCQEMESHMRASSASPHNSPYRRPSSSNGGSVFNYSPGMSSASPVSPSARQTAPVSPYSPHSQISPVSPHMQHGGGGGMSPHSSRSSSCSPVPHHPYMSAVFGRYADASLESYMNGYATDMHGQYKRMDKNTETYRAKRERNNIAVRRSREKKKQREIENEMKVQELTEENTTLQSRLDVVLKEMKLLKSLYQNIGVSLPPEAKNKIEKELSKLTH